MTSDSLFSPDATTMVSGARAVAMRAKILQLLIVKPMSVAEAADALRASVLDVRQRFAELRSVGRIELSPARSADGLVWRLAGT